jgi:hypothetical protein
MNRRWFAFSGLLGLGVVFSQGVTACSSAPSKQHEEAFGTMALPLGAYAESGTRYRLRNATFEIVNYWGGGEGGGGGADSVVPIVVSSEDDPSADSISLSLEGGRYRVHLQPGWHMEKQSNDGSISEVEAHLISSSGQSIYVTRFSTSWVEFHFGIGGRDVWFNGELNINISVYEDPDEVYGSGGSSGHPDTGLAGQGGG